MPSPFSCAIAWRMSATSAAIAAGSRSRLSTARITVSTRAAKSGVLDTTRARVSAMCSQVQASVFW